MNNKGKKRYSWTLEELELAENMIKDKFQWKDIMVYYPGHSKDSLRKALEQRGMEYITYKKPKIKDGLHLCTICDTYLPRGDFSESILKSRSHKCKECSNARERARRINKTKEGVLANRSKAEVNGSPLRTCKTCKDEKDVEDFSWNTIGYYIKNVCKTCDAEKNKHYKKLRSEKGEK